MSEHFQGCRKYYRLKSCFYRACLRCLWTAVTGTKFLFIVNKNYTPWSFQFFILVWNCRATRNKSNTSCIGKPWVCLKGALKFPLSFLFYIFDIHKCFKEASSVILSIPFKTPISLSLNVFHFVNIFLGVWGLGLDKLRFNQLQEEYYHFPSSVLISHSTFYMPISITKIKKTSQQDDVWWFTLSTWLSIVCSEFALNKPSQFLFLTNTVPLLYLCQFSLSVVSDSLQPHELQHATLPCASPTPRTCSNLCPSCWWCHPTILSSIAPFFSCLQYFLQFFSNFLSNIWFWNWSQSSMREREYLYLFTNTLLI